MKRVQLVKTKTSVDAGAILCTLAELALIAWRMQGQAPAALSAAAGQPRAIVALRSAASDVLHDAALRAAVDAVLGTDLFNDLPAVQTMKKAPVSARAAIDLDRLFMMDEITDD